MCPSLRTPWAWQSIIIEKLKKDKMSLGLSNNGRGTKANEVTGCQAVYLRTQDMETVSMRLETS